MGRMEQQFLGRRDGKVRVGRENKKKAAKQVRDLVFYCRRRRLN